jgi:hypothetical protein
LKQLSKTNLLGENEMEFSRKQVKKLISSSLSSFTDELIPSETAVEAAGIVMKRVMIA